MSVHLSAIGNAGQFLGTNGRPLAAGLLYTYAAGTSTPQTTYSDNAGAVPNTNPIVLNADGRVPNEIWLTDATAYKFVLQTSGAVTLGTYDNIIGIGDVTGLVTSAALAASGGSALVGFIQAGTGAATRTAQSKERDFVTLSDFAGVVGNGSNNDTAGINAALASGAKYVYGVQGATYLVSASGSKTLNGIATAYCLQIPSGVTLDLQGATVKLANAANAAIFINANAGVSQDADVAIRNGVLDGNKANQTTPATGDMACIAYFNCLRPRAEHLLFKNVRQYAMRNLQCDRGYWNNLYCTDSDGDGFSFGIDANTGQVTNSFIDNIRADNCTGVYTGGLVGNPAIFTIQYCEVGKVYGKDCNAGVKCQDSSNDSSFAQVTVRGSNNGTSNSGFKVQGNGAGLSPTRVSAAVVTAENCFGSGLFISNCVDVSIGLYSGVGNARGLGAGTHDVEIQTGTDRISINAIKSDTCKMTQAVVNASTGRVQFGEVVIFNPTAVACQATSGGPFDIDSLMVYDDGGGTTTQCLNISGTNKGHCRRLYTNLANSLAVARATIASANYDFVIASFQMGTNAQENIVQLTNGATTTAVANDSMVRTYVGGASDYFHPIIQLLPISATAAALGQMRASVTDSSAGTGFTINHAAAGANDKVMWKILGWKVISAPFA